MVNLYIAPCGKGKTHKLNEIYDEKKKIRNNLCLFFPSGSEIISLIKGNENKTNNLSNVAEKVGFLKKMKSIYVDKYTYIFLKFC